MFGLFDKGQLSGYDQHPDYGGPPPNWVETVVIIAVWIVGGWFLAGMPGRSWLRSLL